MEASREEAVALLGKWAEERMLLEARITFSRSFWGRLRGRVVEASPEGFTLFSDEGTAELKLLFDACAGFLFVDAREVLTPRGRFEGTLAFVLRFDDEGLNDFISLSEIGA
jgi:hypothetical protein